MSDRSALLPTATAAGYGAAPASAPKAQRPATTTSRVLAAVAGVAGVAGVVAFRANGAGSAAALGGVGPGPRDPIVAIADIVGKHGDVRAALAQSRAQAVRAMTSMTVRPISNVPGRSARLGESEYVMVCNAANRLKLIEHFESVRGDDVFKFADETESTAMIALQGPRVMEMIAPFSSEIPSLKRYRFTVKNLLIAKVMVSRTGYTGEDGVEVILPAKFATKAIDMMLKNVDLEAEDAIAKWRTVMGATNPENADEGTLRKQFATNIERNAVHGSDAPETAAVEIKYFFSDDEIVG